jgi:hypothetical protein
LKLISSNDSGGYKRLLFWSYGFWFENFGTPPTATATATAISLSYWVIVIVINP